MTDIYGCSECKKEYKYRKTLVKHINSLHSHVTNVDDHIITSQKITPTITINSVEIQSQFNDMNKKLKETNLELESLTKKVIQLESVKEKRFCIACWEYESSFALSPCGHKMLCGTCAAQLIMQQSPVCPICRARVNDIIQIWDASIRERDTI